MFTVNDRHLLYDFWSFVFNGRGHAECPKSKIDEFFFDLVPVIYLVGVIVATVKCCQTVFTTANDREVEEADVPRGEFENQENRTLLSYTLGAYLDRISTTRGLPVPFRMGYSGRRIVSWSHLMTWLSSRLGEMICDLMRFMEN